MAMKILSLAVLTVSVLIVATGCAAAVDNDESEGSPVATEEGETPQKGPCESVQADDEAAVKSCVNATARTGGWW
jgi:hypothetical protein